MVGSVVSIFKEGTSYHWRGDFFHEQTRKGRLTRDILPSASRDDNSLRPLRVTEYGPRRQFRQNFPTGVVKNIP